MTTSPTSYIQVWIVDDDPDDQYFLGTAFAGIHPTPTLVYLSNGEDLLQRIETAEDLPRLILLDINMPIVDGMTALETIRSQISPEQLPIVMLTTSDWPTHRQQAMALGANEFITKPVTQQEVNTIVQQLARQHL